MQEEATKALLQHHQVQANLRCGITREKKNGKDATRRQARGKETKFIPMERERLRAACHSME